MTRKIRPEPCSSCPYRQDVPSGLWAHHEYEKLRDYDLPTNQQPSEPFGCHATPEAYCCGWAVAHTRRGTAGNHPFDLFALRLAGSFGHWDMVMPDTKTPLFATGNEAADHGQRDIENPSLEAKVAVARLTRKYPRLEEA